MSHPDHDYTDDTEDRAGRLRSLRQSPAYRGTSLIAALLVLTIIIGGAIWVAVSNNGDDSDTAAGTDPAQTAAVTPQTTTPDALPANAFGIPTTDLHGTRIEVPTNPIGQALPQTQTSTTTSADPNAAVPAPQGLMWQQVYLASLPFSTSDGPTTITADGVPGGFARTRQGAALAAWQLDWRAEMAPDAQSEAILSQAAIVSDAARPVATKLTTKGPDFTATARQFPAGTFDAPTAVKVTNYDGSYAHVQFAVPAAPGSDTTAVATSLSVDVVWRDGRWKWVVPADGVTPGQPVTSLDGFTAW
jgi:hypothetical protein